MFSIIFNQIVKMLLILILGIICARVGLIDEKFNSKLADLLLLVINPIVVFSSLQNDYQPEIARNLLIAYGIAVLLYVVMIPLSRLLIRKKGNENYEIERLCVIYANCGFIGIPLVQSILGKEGVLYLSAFITVFNVLLWTHGVSLLTGERIVKKGDFLGSAKSFLKSLCTPMIFACVFGLLFFVLQIRLPEIVTDTLDTVGNMNTPLAMIIAGAAVAEVSLKDMLKNVHVYINAAIRLLLMPAIIFVILLLLPVTSTVAYVALIAAACPTAAACTAFALRYKKNYAYTSELYAFSTVLSLVTIPLFIYIAERLL